ncbi:DNA internalization-related competence protein ComEC/Rec2 [Massilia terrae]|uniref:DNA internalization-related competence protein ComEC/Rec2 n=1 Tax=Massilia terrae TaxID=1811224 RepID=A0ABT2CUA0_9BURK|nr:DNA internalization-related competence protein ComEC/Rec2 [Massilia terrae]MCS0657554.1 DNA internalization-related competence protein ComEC/Rec2 [Massilia terrae]
MRLAILGFVGGASFLQTCASLPSAWQLWACLVAALLVLGLLRGPARTATAGVLLGFAWAAALAGAALSDGLAKGDEGRDVTIVGTIDNLPYRFEQGIRFNFKVEKVVAGGFHVPRHVALGWYSGQHGEDARAADVQPGERWQLTVRLQRPHGNANPGGFDYEAWLLEQGIRATGYVRAAGKTNRRLDAFVPSPGNLVERSRAWLRERILQALPGEKYAGVIVALVIGDQRGIDQSDWAVFNRTGIGHLISISGLHITMVAGMFALGVSALWRRSFFTGAQLPLLLPTQKAAALAGSGIALLYVLLAGFGVPAQRTLYMIGVVAAGLWFGRITSVTHVLCAALGLVVLLDPWAMLWPGFWLSFGAVAVIMYAHAGRVGVVRRGWRGAWQEGWRTQYAVTLGLVPATMLLFAQVSLVSPLANAVAIPLVSFVVTPLALLGAVMPAPLSAPVLLVAHWFVELLAGFLDLIGNQRFAVWAAPEPEPWLFLLALAGTLWMLAPRGWPHRWAGAAAWLPLFLQQPSHPGEGQFRVTAFDVGQGMALLVETRGHRLLYDTGPQYSLDSNGGNRVIVPYLKARGIAKLDGMVISHSDTDHSGGALALLEALPVGWVASSLWDSSHIVQAARRHVRCAAGQHWRWDGIEFDMLQPSIDSYGNRALKANARSCTLRVSGGSHSMLLAGDIEAAQEARLVATMPDKLRADVLLAPHHGSGTSSTPDFLRAVAPQFGVFQVGYRNRYHHPKAQVFERYGERGVRRLRTDDSGAVTLEFRGAIVADEFRRTHARYWYGR